MISTDMLERVGGSKANFHHTEMIYTSKQSIIAAGAKHHMQTMVISTILDAQFPPRSRKGLTSKRALEGAVKFK